MRRITGLQCHPNFFVAIDIGIIRFETTKLGWSTTVLVVDFFLNFLERIWEFIELLLLYNFSLCIVHSVLIFTYGWFCTVALKIIGEQHRFVFLSSNKHVINREIRITLRYLSLLDSLVAEYLMSLEIHMALLDEGEGRAGERRGWKGSKEYHILSFLITLPVKFRPNYWSYQKFILSNSVLYIFDIYSLYIIFCTSGKCFCEYLVELFIQKGLVLWKYNLICLNV